MPTAIAPDVPLVLGRLGCTAEEVRQSLRRAGIRGVRLDLGRCPLARYLRSLGLPRAEVGRSWCWPDEGAYEVGIPLPGHLREFVALFDKGKYPELEG
jgi:hypothetical protein